MSGVKPDNLAKAFMDILDTFKDATEDQVAYALQETAEDCKSELQNAHPQGAKDWSKYNKGWDKTKLSAKKGGKYSITVHNKRQPGLTFLLENGHSLRNGGHTRAFEHIAPVRDKAENKLLENIKKAIR